MNVRFFNTFDTVAPFFRNLLPHLTSRGHQVEAVLARQQYRPGGLRVADTDYRIRSVPTIAASVLGGRGRKASIAASYGLCAAAMSLSSRWPDVNVFLTQPPLFASWGRVLQLLHGTPYCVVGMDLYPWVAVEAGVLPRNGLKTRTAETIAVTYLRHAAQVIVIGRCMAERVAELKVSPERIRLITNWADTRMIRPVPPDANDLREAFGLGGKFVIMYSGNLGISHYFDDILEVAWRLRRISDIVLLFVGDGTRLPEVQRRSEELGLENLRFMGYQKYNQLSQSLGIGDIHFVSLRNGFEGLVVPSKTYGVLAAGRPILYQGSAHGEIARTLAETDTGAVVAQGQVDELEEAVLRAYRDRSWRLAAGERARRLAEERYDANHGLQAYTKVLEGLVDTKVVAS